MKKNKLEIYTINSDYIAYLSRFDSNVMSNQKEYSNIIRPYVGVVFTINNFLYFAPLTHDGKRWIDYRDHIVLDKGDLGAIKMGRMVPIPKLYKDELLSIVIRSNYLNSDNRRDRLYGILLQKQYRYLNYCFNAEIFSRRIASYYRRKLKFKFTLDFKKLEFAANNWGYWYKQLFNLINSYNSVKNTIY